MDAKQKAGMDFEAYSAIHRQVNPLAVSLSNRFEIVARDPEGSIIFRDFIENLVVSVGLDNILSEYLKGAAYTAAFYMGLMSASPTVSDGDVMDSHTGWVEVVAYSEAVRQTVTWGAVAAQKVSNAGSPCVFTINANSTNMGGAFIVTVDTKDDSTGYLYGAGSFAAGNKELDQDDTISVVVTATAAAS